MQNFNEMFADLLDLEGDMDKYEWIMDYGAGTVGLAKEFFTEENLVRGCTSPLWVAKIDGRLWAWGESSIVNGLASMICDWYNQGSEEQRNNFSVNTLASIGLMPLLSMGRQNGVANLISRIKSL
jgi:cysteine desulfuration protein SufE